MQRHGITIPLPGVPLRDHREWFRELADLGYTDVWSAEVADVDAFTPLTLAAAWEPRLRLGTAIVPVFTRGAATLAQCAASLAQAAPGRFAFGIGSSSNVIVERWNGIPFEKPYQRVRDTIRFLRAAFSGEKITEEYETFSVRGFRLGQALEDPPPILVAALRPGMLRLAGREGDGAILNWLSPDDVSKITPHVGEDKEIVARIFVAPTEDAGVVDMFGRRAIAEYMNVPVYRAFQEFLGRGPLLQDMWDAWEAGDRKRALEAIPAEVVDDLLVHGSPEACKARVDAYAAAGVTTPMPVIFPVAPDYRAAVRAMAPTAGAD
jgi:probable F420-dependent oxidoreductase